MASKTFPLTDVARGIHESDFSLTAEDFPSATGNWKVTQQRLHGGLRDGVDLVEINNGRMRLWVLPTRGMGIWRAALSDAALGEQTLGWQSPVRGPVHPKFVPLMDPGGLGWLEGFDELVVRCGLESNGAPEFDAAGKLVYPLHGRVANRPAHHVEVTVDDSAGTITLRGIVEETRFHFQKLRLEASVTTAIDSTSFAIHDQVENFGGTEAGMQMLYHINFGKPLLEPGSQVVAAVNEVRSREAASSTEGWEQFGPAVAGQAESVYFLDLKTKEADQARVLLKNAAGTAGAAVSHDTGQLPCFTLWKNEVASEDGYVTGLEPGTNFPNTRSAEAEQGRVVSLAPGETWSADLEIDWLTTPEQVSNVTDAIDALN